MSSSYIIPAPQFRRKSIIYNTDVEARAAIATGGGKISLTPNLLLNQVVNIVSLTIATGMPAILGGDFSLSLNGISVSANYVVDALVQVVEYNTPLWPPVYGAGSPLELVFSLPDLPHCPSYFNLTFYYYLTQAAI